MSKLTDAFRKQFKENLDNGGSFMKSYMLRWRMARTRYRLKQIGINTFGLTDEELIALIINLFNIVNNAGITLEDAAKNFHDAIKSIGEEYGCTSISKTS